MSLFNKDFINSITSNNGIVGSVLLGTMTLIGGTDIYKYINNKVYQYKIHKEISEIISNYDSKYTHKVMVYDINNFEHDNQWDIDISNKDFANAIQHFRKSNNTKLNLNKYPYYRRLVINRNEDNNVEISFAD